MNFESVKKPSEFEITLSHRPRFKTCTLKNQCVVCFGSKQTVKFCVDNETKAKSKPCQKFVLCSKCFGEYINMYIFMMWDVNGYYHTHNWHGQIVQIVDKAGVTHNAKITIFQHYESKYLLFRCVWNETNVLIIKEDKKAKKGIKYSTYGNAALSKYNCQQWIDIYTLIRLNPNLPKLSVDASLYKIKHNIIMIDQCSKILLN